MEEHREPGEPIGRAGLTGRVSTHQILLSIIARELRAAAPDKMSQSDAYFKALRAALPEWTGVEESMFQAPARSYPVLFGTERVRGPLPPLDTQQDSAVLLYFPDDFPQGRYFYVFFWTDVHALGAQALPLDELRSVVDTFEISGPPTSASRGCTG